MTRQTSTSASQSSGKWASSKDEIRQRTTTATTTKNVGNENSIKTTTTNGHGNGNGVGHVKPTIKKKTDWEIPRKVFHGSIGFVVLYLHSLHPQTLTPLIAFLSAFLVVVFSTDALRFSWPWFNKLYIRVMGFMMRTSEYNDWNGVLWYLIGCVFTLGCLPRDVAVISILTLSWSDTAASTLGRAFGAYTPSLPTHVPLLGLPFARRKSLAGFLAAVVSGFLIGTFWWWNGKRLDGGWGQLWGSHIDLEHVIGVPLGGWRFLGQETLKGKVVQAVTGRPEHWQVFGKPVGMWVSALVLGLVGAVAEAVDLGYDDNVTLPILTGIAMWAYLTVASYVTTTVFGY